MYHLMMTIIDCVHIPVRKDKPHRTLNLQAEFSSEDPVFVELQSYNENGENVFHASLDIDTIEIILNIMKEIQYKNDKYSSTNSNP